MAVPKLLNALSALTHDEWSSLRKHLLMYTREDSDNFRCFLQLSARKEKLLDLGQDEEIRDKYFSKMSPKGYANMLSRLFKWFEEWLATYSFLSEPNQKALQLIKSYNDRGLYRLADQTAHRLESQLRSRSELHLDTNRHLRELYHLQYYSSNPIKSDKGNTLFQDCLKSYTNAIVEQSRVYLLEAANRNFIRQKENDNQELLELLVSTAKGTELSDILNLAIAVFRNESHEDALTLMSVLKSDKLAKDSDLYLILVSYLVKSLLGLWQKGSIEIIDFVEAGVMQLKAIEANPRQKIRPVQLFNTLSFKAISSSIEETDAFISEWIDKVHTKFRKSTLAYCQAINCFRHGDYASLPVLLRGLEFDSYVYKIHSTSLMIIAHYKLEEDDVLMNLIENFKKQLKRNKDRLPDKLWKGMLNLVEVVLALHKSRFDKTIKINLNDYEHLFFKLWAQQELENRAKGNGLLL